jgi:hypothetical protein
MLITAPVLESLARELLPFTGINLFISLPELLHGDS